MSPFTFTLEKLAIAAVAAVVAIFFYQVTRSVRRLVKERWRREADEASQLQLRQTELAMTLHQSFHDLSLRQQEARWFDVQVVRIDQESTDTRSFYLIEQGGEPLPAFLPGQHVLLERPCGRGEVPECRCYSLSEEARAGYWRITVKRASDRETSVSRWLHDSVVVGDRLRVRGPSGAFTLQSCTARHVVFASAGVGVTPMIPMLQQAMQRPHGSIRLFAQFRDVDHAPFAEYLLSFAHRFADFPDDLRIRLFLTRFPRGVKGEEDNAIQEGKFRAADLCEGIDALDATDVYLCGPETWLHGMRTGLLDAGIANENIYFELFHAPANESSPSTNRDKKEFVPCSVHFRQSNRLEEFATAFPSLLGFAIKTDIPMNSGCRTGACGSCAVRLLEGKVRYTRKPQYPLKPNEILPCVCVPDGNIVVDA
ncbi:Flavohemoprotein [Pirellula sp. SH-Sr6A]|uniref:2Fe-2S iron-sulfur cluster-binding protein n=1 Tax=Pirellula sp. SH-Sr6A TaxID=1632865 RepID=UPI00078EF3BB|nr:2Fe-2S iron-sulfur cluster-binding protein [Pirellula sp. SH-Sr6A]AMV33418.1 Flavohemoprotein [Pirellula sp. SH-Sr6A]